MAAAGPRDNETKVLDLGLKLQRPMPDSEGLKPPVDVPASIPPRRFMKASRGKIDLPTGLMQLFGDLASITAPIRIRRKNLLLRVAAVNARLELQKVSR